MAARILVVSPDQNLIQLLGQAMSREGHEVLLAKNPIDGQRRMGIDRPQLTFLDLGEDSGDPTDIVRRLRWKGPVFLISGVTGAGTDELKQAVMRYLEEHPRAQVPAESSAASPSLDLLFCTNRSCWVSTSAWRISR